MKTTYTLSGSKELQAALKKACAEKLAQFKQEVYASGLDIQKKAKENLRDKGAWDTGNAANSILVSQVKGGKEAEIGPTAPYAPYIEFGTKPHFPPLEALEGWAKRHGMDSAWPICLAISKHGTPAQPFMLPALLDVIDGFFKRIKEILER